MALVWLETPTGGVALRGIVAREGAVYNTKLIGDCNAGLGCDDTSCTPVQNSKYFI